MKFKTPAEMWIVFVFVLWLVPMAARAQGGTTFENSHGQVPPDTIVMIEPYYEILGYVGPIHDYTGLIVDRDRLPWAPPLTELQRSIDIPRTSPNDRRGIAYRTFRGEPPGTDLTIAPREWTRVEMETQYREQWEYERQFQPIYGLVTPIRPGDATAPPLK
ncbi:MAG: hypothetical protein ABFD69_14350 [Candidatus Sumerlaeia bacterium]